jgi:uncharacterized membrane protein YphA (DoxX/SURF4 family)
VTPRPGVRAGLALAGRLAAGAVLAISGFWKLMSPAEELAMAMESYRLLPAGLLLPAAKVLPWAEWMLGLCLILGFAARVAVPAAMGLFSLFVAALLSTVLRGVPVTDCGCFGQGLHLSPLQAVALDLLLLGLLVPALLDKGGPWSLDRFLSRPAP